MNRRIRIVQMIPALVVGDHGGGAELFAIRLAESLDPALFDVTVHCIWRFDLPIEQQWQRHLAERGITVLQGCHTNYNPYETIPQSYLYALPQLARRRPDIINTHVEYPDLVGVGLRLSGVCRHLVRTCHIIYEWPRNPGFHWRANWLNVLVPSAEVGVSRAIVEHLNLRPAARLLHRKVRYINNGVDAETMLRARTGKNLRDELGIPTHVPLFGTVGRVVKQKGMDDIVRAMPQVRAALPDAHLLIIGMGDEEPHVRALIAELGLEACVSMLGARSDIADSITSLDVFVLASLWEGLPTVVMEAMVLGTPVVATNIAGTRDLILDGQTGLLVPPRNPQALAAAMVRQYTERDAAQRMAAAAQTHAEQFSFRRVAQQYTALYHELIERRWYQGRSSAP